MRISVLLCQHCQPAGKVLAKSLNHFPPLQAFANLFSPRLPSYLKQLSLQNSADIYAHALE